jgi:GNAT superfamily N-acetyltransferase
MTGPPHGRGVRRAAAPPDVGPPVCIRTAAMPADWTAVRELCCRTADAGNPIDRSRWPLFAELWIGPYQGLAPRWTYVAEADGRVVAYLTGCPDTAAFRRGRRARMTLPLLLRLAGHRYPWNVDARRFVRLALRLERGAEARLAATLPVSLGREYPAHLHMNVEAEYRRRGIGGALIERYAADLRAAAVPGVHLFCGPDARRFYLRHGFTDLGALEARPGRWVHALGRRVTGR